MLVDGKPYVPAVHEVTVMVVKYPPLWAQWKQLKELFTGLTTTRLDLAVKRGEVAKHQPDGKRCVASYSVHDLIGMLAREIGGRQLVEMAPFLACDSDDGESRRFGKDLIVVTAPPAMAQWAYLGTLFTDLGRERLNMLVDGGYVRKHRNGEGMNCASSYSVTDLDMQYRRVSAGKKLLRVVKL